MKRISYLLIFFDVLNANGSRSYYSPLKAGSPVPLHNPLVSGERGEITVGPLWANIYTLVVYAVRESHSVLSRVRVLLVRFENRPLKHTTVL